MRIFLTHCARRPSGLALVAVALAAPAGASAATPPRSLDTTKLWATINVCDTPSRPNTMGLRASMPGGGNASDQLFVRFQAQYYNEKDRLWRNLASGGDTGFLDIGPGKQKAREVGRSFVFAPLSGRDYQLRGVVTFEWRRGGVVLRSLLRRTTAGHTSSAGADPPDFSAATCTIA